MSLRPSVEGTDQEPHCEKCGRGFSNRGALKGHQKSCGTNRGAELFWAKVKKTETCWLYTGFRKWDGYGWLARYIDGKHRNLTAHRYAWILTHGSVPEGMHILHKCDVPACCNPDHLDLGTHQDNMADQYAKNRHVYGERNRRNKITFDDAQAIRKRLAEGEDPNVLAQEYGIVRAQVISIKAGRCWANPVRALPLHPGRVRPERQP